MAATSMTIDLNYEPVLEGFKRQKLGCEMVAVGRTPSTECIIENSNFTTTTTTTNIAYQGQSSDVKKFSFLNDQVYHLQGSELGRDDLHYSQAWFSHYKKREHLFQPWNPTLGDMSNPWEVLRIQAIQTFWKATKTYRISPVTVHLAVWILNKLLSHFASSGDEEKLQRHLSRAVFAGVVAVSFRMALKFEERPDALWSIRRIWEVLPMFNNWDIDRSDQFLMKVESEALRVVDDCFDVPLAIQFFDKYIMVGGWPKDLVKEYIDLGHFLLALSTFASGTNNPLMNVPPSKLAAATVVLSVKIVNSDSRRSYEFFPERFAAFSGTNLKDLQSPIKGLSLMLRKKPNEASILGRIYPEWGDHEWM